MNKPLVPSDLNLARSIPRAAFATLMTALRGGGQPAAVAQRMWPGDDVTMAVLRAATTGGTTTGAGWAADLAQTALSAWLPTLYPISAAGELIRRGLTLTIEPNAHVAVPGRSNAPAAVAWVGEGAPIPARQYALNRAMLTPKKMAAIVVWSRELQRFSDAETVFTALLNEDAAASLDSAYFSATATSGVAHGGLLNGLTTLTPATAGASPEYAMLADMSALARAVSPASTDSLVFIAAPGRAAAANLISDNDAAEVLPSVALAADRLIAVDARSLVHAFGALPDISASDEATVVLQDTPTDIGVPGSPNVVGAPTSSMFQTAQMASRLIIDVAFAMRRSGAVAFIDGCTW
jgi:hypothetical protein